MLTMFRHVFIIEILEDCLGLDFYGTNVLYAHRLALQSYGTGLMVLRTELIVRDSVNDIR
jgi:hypothetical protein